MPQRRISLPFQRGLSDRIQGLSSGLAAGLRVGNGSTPYRFYRYTILKYSGWKPEEIYLLKAILFVVAVALSLMVRWTNTSMQMKEIFERFEFRMDMIYTSQPTGNEEEALAQEIRFLKLALETIQKEELEKGADRMMESISRLIDLPGEELFLPRETLVNKIYNRFKTYHEISALKLPYHLLIAAMISFLPELFLLIWNVFQKAEAKRELRFLKKLIILNGSIKPVDFREILKALIDKSKHYRSILQEFEDGNRRSSENMSLIYGRHIRNAKDLDVKLFFEKLDQGNNYNFEQAVINIENEFRLERREDMRSIRKRIELIHVMGVVGFMVIIVILVLYLIEPWLRMYDMRSFGL